MIRQYYAQRARGGDNPLRVGTVAAGEIFYLQDEGAPLWRKDRSVFKDMAPAWTVSTHQTYRCSQGLRL